MTIRATAATTATTATAATAATVATAAIVPRDEPPFQIPLPPQCRRRRMIRGRKRAYGRAVAGRAAVGASSLRVLDPRLLQLSLHLRGARRQALPAR